MSLLLTLLLQVGPNPVGPDNLDLAIEQTKRPARSEAAGNATSAWLQDCLDQMDEDAARAYSKAQIRLLEVSGADRVVANHCLGLAATELGRWGDAQTAFINAREETPADEPRTRARFGLMAGNAALVGGDPQEAVALLATARADAKRAQSATLDALGAMDSARALVLLERNEEALSELRASTALEPANAEGWLLQATLLRRLERLAEAQGAIEEASRLAPMEAEIGLEAGVIAVLQGRIDAARQSWQSIIDIQPDSLAAEKARGYLAQIAPDPTPEAATDEPS